MLFLFRSTFFGGGDFTFSGSTNWNIADEFKKFGWQLGSWVYFSSLYKIEKGSTWKSFLMMKSGSAILLSSHT